MTQDTNPPLEKMLLDLPVRVDVILGEARIPMDELIALPIGEIVALERHVNEPVDILVSGQLVARGRLVICDGELGITLSEIVDSRPAAA